MRSLFRPPSPRRATALTTLCLLALGLLAAPAALADDGADGGGAVPAPGFHLNGEGAVRFTDTRVTEPTGTVTGELQEVVADHPDGSSRTSYLVTGDDGRSHALSFAGEDAPDTVNGATVTARVTRAGAVRSARLETSRASAAPAARAAVAQRAYVAVVSNKGAYPHDDAAIQATVRKALTRWRTESEGRISSFGLASYRKLATSTSCTSGPRMWDEASSRTFPGVDFGGRSGNHLVVLAPRGCAGGIGTVGSRTTGLASGGKLSISYDPRANQVGLLHELGHNFSLEHANAAYCNADGKTGCGDHEYGNYYAFMGVSIVHTPAYDGASLDSFERARLGLLASGEVATVQLPSGSAGVTRSYALAARGGSTGLRGLRVVDPRTGAVYWVDWRNAGGRDASSYYADTRLASQQTNAFLPGVTVERQLPNGTQSQLQSHRKPSPKRGSLFAYTAGQAFAAGGTRITVTSIGSTARVTVGLGAAATARAAKRFTSVPTPVVDRHRKVGSVLRVDPRQASQKQTAWAPAATRLSFHWYVGGRSYAQTSRPALRLTGRMVGKRVNCLVTGSRAGYAPARTYSTLSRTVRR